MHRKVSRSKIHASKGSSRLTPTSTTIFPWAPWEWLLQTEKSPVTEVVHIPSLPATAGCVKSIMSPIIGEDQISLQQGVGTEEWLNSLWHSITGACKLHRRRIKKRCVVMTIPFLPVPSGSTITAPHIRLHMHSGIGNILLSSGSVVQRPNLGLASAMTHVYTAPLLHRASEIQIYQTSEIRQDCSAIV